jgi:hypothetical protein
MRAQILPKKTEARETAPGGAVSPKQVFLPMQNSRAIFFPFGKKAAFLIPPGWFVGRAVWRLVRHNEFKSSEVR